ncbi:MAG TPA: hypothetical protein VFP84_38675 [Kofleriaceae bacterium]|nr:hypothetical protein [Kofleriaceae bacterium]
MIASGCHSSSIAPRAEGVAEPAAAAVSERPRSTNALALATDADQLLLQSMRLDFEQGVPAPPVDRLPVRAMYLKACQAGDHRSCWMATSMATPNSTEPVNEAEAIIRKNCAAGDRLSCRAFGDLAKSLDDDPTHSALVYLCLNDEARCDFAGIRRECSGGFPYNCFVLTFMDSFAPDMPDIVATGITLTREGCRAGVAWECEQLEKFLGAVSHPAWDDRVLALEQQCTIQLSNCNALGALYRSTSPDKARDAYEHGCQYKNEFDITIEACKPLWAAYTDPKSGILEPVPGRAKQLHDSACEKYRACW